jgi:hypothetical protein
MARLPGWDCGLGPAARWLLAQGLESSLTAPAEPLGDEAWSALGIERIVHRLDGLLVDAVMAERLPVTPSQLEAVAQVEVELTRARMWHESWLTAVSDRLTTAGIELRVLKGQALAALDYPDAQMRPTGDLDLLVHGADLARAGQLLEDDGAVRLDPEPYPGYSAEVGKGATYTTEAGEVDLHRLLVWGPLGVRLDPEILWADQRRFGLGGQTFATLGLDDTLLHAACHLMVLGARRGLQLRDVAQLLAHPDLDPGRLLVRARQWGAEAVLATALVLAGHELGLSLDDELGRWANGFVPTWRDRLWLRVESPVEPLAGLEAVATFVELTSRQQRAGLWRATVRPAPDTWASPAVRVRSLGRRLARRP